MESLRSRYHSRETVQLYKNFVHDRDFDLLLGKFVVTWQGSIEKYEQLGEQLQIKVPNNQPRDFKTTMKISQITDDLIYRRIYNDLTAELLVSPASTDPIISNFCP